MYERMTYVEVSSFLLSVWYYQRTDRWLDHTVVDRWEGSQKHNSYLI